MTNAAATYNFIVHISNNKLIHNEIIDSLKEYCKKWAFQLNESPTTGEFYYQGKMSLKVKVGIGKVLEMFSGWHIGITKNEDYNLCDSEYKIDGPWTSEDKEVIYVPRQIREIEELYPWQQTVLSSADSLNDDHINIVYDTEGNCGKSILCMYMEIYGKAVCLEYCENQEEFMRMVYCLPKSRTYLMELSRAFSKEDLKWVFKEVENMKDGKCVDSRYSHKYKALDHPNIWIFTSQLPEIKYLVGSRWVFWGINKDMELENIERNKINEMQKKRKGFRVVKKLFEMCSS